MEKNYIFFILLLFIGSTAFSQSSINPSLGFQGQTLPVIISGQNVQFQGTGTVNVALQSQNGYVISSGSSTGFSQLQVLNPSTISGVLAIPSTATIGAYSMVVSAGTVTYNQSAFTVTAPSSNLVSSVPSASQPGNTLNVQIVVNGASFKNGMSGVQKVWLSKGNEVIESFANVQVTAPDAFTSDLTLPPAASFGYWDVNVLDNNGMMYLVTDYFEIDEDVSLQERPGLVLSYFPNPAANKLTVACEGNRPLQLEILDLQGRLLDFKRLKGSDTDIYFDVSNLAEGTYLLRISENGKVLATKKWIKQ